MTPSDDQTSSQPVPFGWIYQIDGDFPPGDHIPPAAIVGAWETDGRGNPVGEFMKNPAFEPAREEESRPNPEAEPPADFAAGMVAGGFA